MALGMSARATPRMVLSDTMICFGDVSKPDCFDMEVEELLSDSAIC
jgi:hypothetical protein